MNRGIEKYVTPDGVAVMRLHYSADPEKDPETDEGREWLINELHGYPDGMKGTKWRREMEIDYSIRGKSRVWQNWSEMQPKVTCDPFQVPDHWPIYVGYDYGYREPFCAVFLAFETTQKCYLVDEIYASKKSIYEQAELIKHNPYWERSKLVIGDPSIWHKTENDGLRVTTKGDLLRDYGVNCLKGRKEPGVDVTFRDLLQSKLWRNLDKPHFVIFSHCKNTLKEFKNIQFKDHVSPLVAERNPLYEDLVTKHVNAWDSIKYVLLSQPIASFDVLPPPEGTIAALRKRLKEMRQRRNNLLQ